ERGNHAESGPEQCDNHALDQYLEENGRTGCANGLANANFPDPFVDARQHNVNDANAADEKADSSDDSSAHPAGSNLLVNGLELSLLRLKAEVLDSSMGQHQHVSSLLKRGLEHLHFGNFQIDV